MSLCSEVLETARQHLICFVQNKGKEVVNPECRGVDVRRQCEAISTMLCYPVRTAHAFYPIALTGDSCCT
eukprot:341854-Amphidinium_carterae.1